MFRFLLCITSFVCLFTIGLMLWKAHVFPDLLPQGAAGWVAALYNSFHNPTTTLVFLTGTFLLTAAAACISEFLLGLVFSLIAATAAILCLIGFLGSHYPEIGEFIEKLVHWKD